MPPSDYEKRMRSKLDSLIVSLQEAKKAPTTLEETILALMGVVDFIDSFPYIKKEYSFLFLAAIAGLKDVGNGLQPSWLKPAKRKGGKPPKTTMESYLKEHTVLCVKWLMILGDDRKQAVESMSKILTKKKFQINKRTVNKWVTEFNTAQKTSDAGKRIDKLIQRMEETRQTDNKNTTRTEYLKRFEVMIDKEIKAIQSELLIPPLLE